MKFALRPNTLSGQLNLYLGLGLGVFALLAGLLIHQLVTHTLDQTLRDKAEALSQQLALVTLDSVLIRDYAVVERYADDLVKQGHGIVYLKITTEQNQILAQSGQLPTSDKNALRQITPIQFLNREIGQIELHYSRALVQKTFRNLMAVGLLGLVLILVVQSWMIKWFLQRRLIDPIQRLVETIHPLSQSLENSVTNQPEEVRQIQAHFDQLNDSIRAHIAALNQAHQFTTQANERLRDGQRLASIGQMAAGLAHNLNTPLANIVGYVQMTLQTTDNHKLQERMQIIERQAKTCSNVVKSLLNAARQPDTQMTEFDLQPFLQSFCDLVRPVLQQKGLKTLQLDADPFNIRADQSLLEQVLFNLLDNAVDAGADEIIIQLNHQAWLDIVDNGEGIPSDKQQAIFDAFITTKPAGKGTGLGLFLSQQMLKSMQSTLCLLASQPGQTHFRIDLQKMTPNHE
ncbi:sensor histidine kinase [Thiomicrospira pelophila]|uniref:sensor histidine kinase n=1 Tax=Thiomicrospira pelophila TaxID=934 RepID=UPI0004A6CF90|nr:HAMP domain-containing sensor histidine kinase [Thiomicrospira pelophila]